MAEELNKALQSVNYTSFKAPLDSSKAPFCLHHKNPSFQLWNFRNFRFLLSPFHLCSFESSVSPTSYTSSPILPYLFFSGKNDVDMFLLHLPRAFRSQVCYINSFFAHLLASTRFLCFLFLFFSFFGFPVWRIIVKTIHGRYTLSRSFFKQQTTSMRPRRSAREGLEVFIVAEQVKASRQSCPSFFSFQFCTVLGKKLDVWIEKGR